MSQDQTQDVLSETEGGTIEGDGAKLVPVGESIRYRRRAQSAEKQVEDLNEELAGVRAQAERTSQELSQLRSERELVRKLSAVGVVDLEAAVMLARSRMEGQDPQMADDAIEQLRKEKRYLFADSGSQVATATKTAGARERVQRPQAAVDRAAKRAATTGKRVDVHEYLRLRRSTS